jgi:hypothetical protein
VIIKKGRIGTMRAIISVLAWLGMSLTISNLEAAMVAPGDSRAEESEALRSLRAEISVANLINGLHLGTDQTRQILDLALQAQAIVESGRCDLAEIRPEMETAYADLHTDVVTGNGIRPEVRRRALRVHMQELEVRHGAEGQVRALEERVEALLTEGQRQTLLRFTPCLLPQQWLNEPPRAGQSGSNQRTVQAIERLRALPDPAFARREGEIAERHLTGLRERDHVNLSEEEQRDEARRVQAIVRSARSMSDLEWSMHQEEIADDVRLLPHRQEAWEMEQRERYEPTDRPGRTARFLFGDAAIAVLQARVDGIDGHHETEGEGLVGITPADNCDNGQCALPPQRVR